MTRVLVRCAGATLPRKVESQPWDRRESIDHRGDAADLNINIRAPQSAFDSIDGITADLLRLGAYAFAADQEVSRGGQADVYGDDWRRDFTLYLPVSDVDFWSRPEVVTAAEGALSFASDDTWRLVFVAAPRRVAFDPIGLDLDSKETMTNPDVVCLFSGGLDSLCSVVEQTTMLGRRPALVGHSPSFHVGPRQQSLYRELRQKLPWSFPYVSGAVHRIGTDAKETTQRTRSFLYGTLGVVAARYLGLTEVQLADNGIVSLNLPINASVLGAQATRSTHPKFIRLFNRLLEVVLPGGPRVSNPLALRTRAETLEVLRTAGLETLITLTNSCAHQRGRSASQPYCSLCSQCIDRRYAMISAGLDGFDPPERYERDVFCDALPDGPKRTLAVAYYEFARHVATMTDEDIVVEYPISDCIDPVAPAQARVARDLVAMVKRHGAGVVEVMRTKLHEHADDLLLQRLPESSLLAIVAGQRSQTATIAPVVAVRLASPAFVQSEDLCSVRMRGADFVLTKLQGAVVHRLKRELDRGTPNVRWDELRESVVAVGGHPKTITDVFKDRTLRNQLLIQVQKGVYRLNLEPHPALQTP